MPVGQGSGVWPHSPAIAVRTAMDAAVHDDAAAAAGAEDDAEDHAEPGAGAVGRLAEGEAVGVVLDPDLAFERLAHVVVEAMAVQGDGVGVLDQAGGGADDTGDADADGAGDAEAASASRTRAAMAATVSA